MKRTVIRISCFLILLTMVLMITNHVFKVKYGDGIYGCTKFYELEDNTVDVLFLGSSHAFEGFNTGVLWSDYGMAAYILAGSDQPLWNTYYYLKEALKTQKPELIVLEGYLTTYQREYIDDSRIIKNNFGLKWSGDKIDSIKVSAPKERWGEFLLEYVQYHNRYAELSREDFLPDQGKPLYRDWKGFGCNMNTSKLENRDVSHVTERAPLSQKTETYYRKIIELAQENSIPITVVISPYAEITEEQQKRYHTAEEIAAEYGVDFNNYNLCYQETELDFTKDAADGGHLNYRGSLKFSEAVGKYLKANYVISDRRGDPRYQSWEKNADFIKEQIDNQILTETGDMRSFLSQIGNENYSFFISIDGSCHSGMEGVKDIMDAFHITYEGHRGIWYIDTDGEIWYSGGEEAEKYIKPDGHDICMRRVWIEDAEDYANTLIVDNTEYKNVKNGINITVYSSLTQTIVDSVGFDADDSFCLIR